MYLRFSFVVFFLFASSDWCRADDTCALTVQVITADGLRYPSPMPVTLLDTSGRTIERRSTVAGTVEFCDFGFGDHTVLVGDDQQCGSLYIRHIRFFLGQPPEKFKVVAPVCKGGATGGINCGVYLRISNSDGEKVPGAELWLHGALLHKADNFGRILLAMRNGQTEKYSVVAPNHASAEVSLTCRRNDQIEREVVLKRQ